MPMKRVLPVLLALLLCLAADGAKAAPAKDFRVRGFHLDLKVQTMTPEALKAFARDLSAMGVNAILMEWEATFPFDRHAVISNRHAYTPAEVREFIAYCSRLGLDVIPLQQTFGHVEYILQHDRYAPLRENFRSEFSQVCPLDPASERIFKDIVEEVAAVHPSPYFHIGCDETFLLGLCPKCSAYVKEHGKSRLFVEYVAKMCKAVTELGKRPILWADIITKYPEAVDLLPKDAILMDWNYGWDIKHFGDIDKLYASGLEIWGAPALRSDPDTHYLITWNTHFDNQRDYIPYCREAGYQGIVMTSWSASGLYGLFFENKNEVAQIDAVRQVYPNNGFRLLLAMYAEAVRQSEPIDPHGFTVGYAQKRFGLSRQEGERLWAILSEPPVRFKFGKPMGRGNTVESALETAARNCETLRRMKPRRNAREFEHFRLQADLRMQYLEFKAVDSAFNAPDFDRSRAPGLLAQLEERVLSQTPELDRRFAELHGDFLKPAEIDYQNRMRSRKMEHTHRTLKALVQ